MNRTSIFTLLAVLTLLVASKPAMALTQAGLDVTNVASVTYSVSGVTQTAIESSPTGNSTPGSGNGTNTTFKVDQKIDILVATIDASPVGIAPGGTAVTTFTVTNEGNDTQDILLAAVAKANGTANPFGAGTDIFDSSAAVVFYKEAGGAGAGGFDVTDTVVTYLDEVAKETSVTVYMQITAPGARVQNDLSVYALKGTLLAGGGVGSQGAALTNDSGGNGLPTLEIVFADSVGTDDTDLVNPDAEHSARSAYIVTTASLTVTKTTAVFDTGAGLPSDTYAIPGAIMTYSILIANSGSVSATGVTIVDEIPTNTSFYVISGPTGGDTTGTQYEYSNQTPFLPAAPTWTETPIADVTTGVDTNVTAIKIKAPDIGAGGSATVTFKVKID